MIRPPAPVAELSPPRPPPELRDRLAALEARMRPLGGRPRRDRGGGWSIPDTLPADLVRAWLATVAEIGDGRP